MTTRRTYLLLSLTAFIMLISGCKNDPCIVGDWTWLNQPPALCPNTRVVFTENTMHIIESDCYDYCAGVNPNRFRVWYYSWTESDNRITIKFQPGGSSNNGETCGTAVPNMTLPGYLGVTDSLVCDLACNNYAATLKHDSTQTEPFWFYMQLDR